MGNHLEYGSPKGSITKADPMYIHNPDFFIDLLYWFYYDEDENEQTDSDDDRIHKNDFVNLYNEDNRTKLNWSHLMSDVKRLGLTYKNDGRVKGAGTKAPKGVIVGLKLIDNDEFLINTKNQYEFVDGKKEL